MWDPRTARLHCIQMRRRQEHFDQQSAPFGVIGVHKQTPLREPYSGMKLSESCVQNGVQYLGSGAFEETGGKSSIDGIAEGIQFIECPVSP